MFILFCLFMNLIHCSLWSIKLLHYFFQEIIRFKKYLYSKLHRTYFLTLRFLIMSLVFSVSTLLSIPSATLWYFQLVLYLSNDISRNPGPVYTNHTDEDSPSFSFCNWNVNTLSKYDFSKVSLLNGYNSIHKYDIISLCESSLSKNKIVHEDILPRCHYHGSSHPSGEKKGGVGIV